MKLLFAVNPISGGVDKEPFLKQACQICEKYGIEYQIFRTTGKDDKENLLKEVANFEPDKVASCGGDGTTLFTGEVLLGTDVPMGIIPLGSANGMATELFVPNDPIAALKDMIMSNVVRDLDLLLVNDKHFCVHIGDVGINANLVEAYDKDPKRGMATYAKYFLKELQKLNYFNYKITSNGESYEGKSLMLAICNARKFGTGVPLNLDGNPFDGKFELISINKMNEKVLIKAGLSSFNESFYNSGEVDQYSLTEADIEFESPQLLQLDGEVIGKLDRVNIKLNPQPIKLITHLGNIYVS